MAYSLFSVNPSLRQLVHGYLKIRDDDVLKHRSIRSGIQHGHEMRPEAVQHLIVVFVALCNLFGTH